MRKAVATPAGIKAQPPTPTPQAPRIALALGGGGARGLAHILILEAFDELGIRPVFITGTSIGAIYGAAYAAGLSAAYIRAHTEEVLGQRLDLARNLIAARSDPVQKLFRLFSLRSSLLKPETLLEHVLPSRVPRQFSDLAIPLAVVATDFYAQDSVIFSEGDLRQAIAASIALPVIFQPVIVNNRALMDGGLVDPLPFDLAQQAADITVAVDVSGAPRSDPRDMGPGAVEAIVACSQILQRSLVREKLKRHQPDVYIDVDVDAFHVLEFNRFREILAAGAPAKDLLKRKLALLMASHTVPASEPVPVLTDQSSETMERPPGKRRRLSLGLKSRKRKG
ncbi:MAG TPA: patatin-like phospholipase family protein [Hyphomicrobiaceae bacterium]|nr:patatin-like phospholipase family protein [Hyphomicrobiaceae bacterium]